MSDDLDALSASLMIGLERMWENGPPQGGIVQRGPMIPVSREIVDDMAFIAYRRPSDRIDWPHPFPLWDRAGEVFAEAGRRTRAAWFVLRGAGSPHAT